MREERREMMEEAPSDDRGFAEDPASDPDEDQPGVPTEDDEQEDEESADVE